jgi:hypothetical protein
VQLRERSDNVATYDLAPLALGTAQFGLDYGIANRLGRVGAADVSAILQLALSSGVDTLDTAIAYGSSEVVLGAAGVAQFKVITKLPPLPEAIEAVGEWVRSQVQGALDRLKLKRLDAVLLHRSGDLLGRRGGAYLECLKQLKVDELTGAIGVSIYAPEELERLWSAWQPDIVQAPCNVLDRRLLHSGWLDTLSRSKVRVHLRSAFLQGLLLMRPGERSAFGPWAAILDRWSEWCEANQVSAVRAALTFARQLPGVERVVVGVDSPAHLQEIVSLGAAVPLPPADLFSDDLKLIDPSKWQLK